MRVAQLEVAQCGFKPRRAGSKVWGLPEAQLKEALGGLGGLWMWLLEASQAISGQSK